MVIFLMILKIIGIVLLSVIGLVIFLLLLVIFCPICYHVNARHNEDETNVEFDARYLLVKALGSYNKDDGLKYLVKIPFYTIATSEDSEDSDNNEGGGSSGKDEFDEDFNLEDDSFADTGDSETSSENIEAASDSLESSSDEQEDEMILPNDEEIEANLKEQKKQEKLRKKQLKKEAREKKKQEKANAPKEPLSDKVDDFLGKTEETLTNLDEKYQNILTKIDHVIQFLDRDYVQRTIGRVFKIIKRLLGTVKPKKSEGYLKLGLSSMADTGMIVGWVSAFYPLYGNWLTIEPDFYNKVIEGNLDIKGRMYVFRFLGPAIRMVLTRDFWKTIKLAKKI